MKNDHYQAGLFDQSVPKGKTFGHIEVLETSLRFEGNGHVRTLPLDELELRRGGANDRLIFFSHPASPDVTIHTPKFKILDAAPLVENFGTGRQIRKIRASKRRSNFILLCILMFIPILCYGLFASRGPIARVIARELPPDLEGKLGASAFAQVTIDKTLVESPELKDQLDQLLAPLLEVLPSSRYTFQFHILDDSRLNAFAMPGGYVVLHSGLLLKADAPEEILGVVAHEIAHVTEQHSMRNIIESAGLFLIVQSFFGDLSGLAAIVTEGGAGLLQQGFSRSFEEEADDVGLRYLVQAGVQPHGLVDFLNKILEKQNKTIVGKAMENLSWLSTHPATNDRIGVLSAKISKILESSQFARSNFNLAKFQESLQKYLTEKK